MPSTKTARSARSAQPAPSASSLLPAGCPLKAGSWPCKLPSRLRRPCWQSVWQGCCCGGGRHDGNRPVSLLAISLNRYGCRSTDGAAPSVSGGCWPSHVCASGYHGVNSVVSTHLGQGAVVYSCRASMPTLSERKKMWSTYRIPDIYSTNYRANGNYGGVVFLGGVNQSIRISNIIKVCIQ